MRHAHDARVVERERGRCVGPACGSSSDGAPPDPPNVRPGPRQPRNGVPLRQRALPRLADGRHATAPAVGTSPPRRTGQKLIDEDLTVAARRTARRSEETGSEAARRLEPDQANPRLSAIGARVGVVGWVEHMRSPAFSDVPRRAIVHVPGPQAPPSWSSRVCEIVN